MLAEGLNFPMASGHACPAAATSHSFREHQPWKTLASFCPFSSSSWLLLPGAAPARARQQAFLKVQSELVPGARVMIASGIFGEIVSVGDDTIELRVAANTVVTVKRQAVAQVIPAHRPRRPETEPRRALTTDGDIPKSRGTKAASNLPRPRRTLVLFLAAIIALYGLVALIDLNNKKGDGAPGSPGSASTSRAAPASRSRPAPRTARSPRPSSSRPATSSTSASTRPASPRPR